jgi:hypothetical protein
MIEWHRVEIWAKTEIEEARNRLEISGSDVTAERGRIAALRDLLELPNTLSNDPERKVGIEAVPLTGGPEDYV